MALTVRNVLEFDAFHAAKLVAGQTGLDREVRIANIMESPDVANWMKGGELLITNGYTLKNLPELRKKLVFDLVAKGVAALGIRPGKYFKAIPADMIASANEVGLPLIELPAELAYMDMMLPILEYVINSQYTALKKSEETHQSLLEVVLEEKGLSGVCQSLSGLMNNPVLIASSNYNLLAYSFDMKINEETKGLFLQEILKELRKESKRLKKLPSHHYHEMEIEINGACQYLVIVPIEVSGVHYGYLILLNQQHNLDAQDLISIENTSTIVALEVIKNKTVFETEKQIRGELLEDLIYGNYTYEETVIRRAGFLNFNLFSPVAIFYIAIDGFEAKLLQDDVFISKNISGFKDDIYKIVHSYFLDYSGKALFMDKSDCVIGLVNRELEEDNRILKQKLKDLLYEINAKLSKKFTASIGVGRSFVGVENIKKSFEGAKVALDVGRFLKGPASLTFFSDLGSYLLLHELRDSKTAATFFQNHVGGILKHDQEKEGELFKTLVHYFQCDCNIRLAADSLYIHKNTVLYRLKIIETLTGLDLKKPEDKFNLQLAIKLGQVSGRVASTSIEL